MLLALSPAVSAWAGLRPPEPGGPVAAMFPPWWRAEQAFAVAVGAGADAVVAAGGAWPSVVVGPSPDPDLPARLRAAGAWLLVDPTALGACTGRRLST